MHVSGATRLTLSADAETYASSVAYYNTQTGGHPLWWDLRSTYVWFANRGDVVYTLKFWVRKFQSLIAGVNGLDDEYVLQHPDTDPGQLVYICTTRCLFTMMWSCVNTRSQAQPINTALMQYLVAVAQRVLTHVPPELRVCNLQTSRGVVAVRMSPGGVVDGFGDALRKLLHLHWATAVGQDWSAMRDASFLHGDLLAPSHHISDIMTFLMYLKSWRASQRRRPMHETHSAELDSFRDSLVGWLAVALEWYTLHVHTRLHNVSKPPPAFKKPARGTTPTPQRVRLHPEAVWRMLEKTTSVNISLHDVAHVRKDDDDAGCNYQTLCRWEAVIQGMYIDRLKLAWPQTHHLCLTADSSTHCYNDALLAIGYSWELGQCCHPQLQFIVPGKDVHAQEDLLAESIGRIAAQGRCERVAAYRQLQALSHISVNHWECWECLGCYRSSPRC